MARAGEDRGKGTVTAAHLLLGTMQRNQLVSKNLSASNDKSKIVVHQDVGGRLSINLDKLPANGAEICIRNTNGILTINQKTVVDEDTGWHESEEKNDAQVSRKEMEKFLSGLETVLKDDRVTSILDPADKLYMEDVIAEGKQFLNLNPEAKRYEIEEKIDMLKILCEPQISAILNGLSTTPDRVKAHFSHSNPDHEFKWVEGSGVFNCEGCKQHGWGKRYECDSCSESYFHQECLEAKPTAFNDFIGASFELFTEPKGKHFKACACESEKCRRKCNACGKLVERMVYYCEEEDIALHPQCFKLEREISAGGISFYLRDNMAKKACACCGKKKVGSSSSSIRGWSYVSKDEEYHIHVSCAMEMVSQYSKKRRSTSNSEVVLRERELSLEKKKHKKGAKFLKIMFSVLKAIVGMLLGDPITPLLIFVADQVFNL